MDRSRPTLTKTTTGPEEFLEMGPVSDYQQRLGWPLFADTPLGTQLRYRFFYQVMWSAEDCFGFTPGLYPGHTALFNFEKDGETGEKGAAQLVVGRLLAKTHTDSVYTAMVWQDPGVTAVYGLVRAPTFLCPARWGGGVCEDPYLGVVRPEVACAQVLPRPERSLPIRLLLPENRTPFFSQCISHGVYPVTHPRRLEKSSFLPDHLFPLPTPTSFFPTTLGLEPRRPRM